MNDALCGPSNPLRSIQKHTSADRSLQNDRLTSRVLQSEEFRSHSPNKFAGEGELEAFQNVNPPEAFPTIHREFPDTHFHPVHLPGPVPAPGVLPGHEGASYAPGWVAGFHGSSGQAHDNFQLPPNSSSLTSSWNQEFLQQQLRRSPAVENPFSRTTLVNQPTMYYAGHNVHMNNLNQVQRANDVTVPQFDDAAFERAFAVANAELNNIHLEATEPVSKDKQPLVSQSEELLNPSVNFTDEAIIEALQARGAQESEEVAMSISDITTAESEARMREETTEQQQQDQRQQTSTVDQDDMARTATAVLESVSNNQSAKFQQSKFLELMRKFRDKEVRVEGKNIVDTGIQDSGPV